MLLFVERARNVSPEFTLIEQNCADIAAICATLDGLPLAIELAAAHSALLDPAALRARLGQSALALGSGLHDRPLRQQSLPNALRWSYDLLSAREQFLFRRLGLFAGSCTLDAVAAVAGGGADSSAQRAACLDPLDALIRHSLVQRVSAEAGATRYTLLKTIRAFAAEQLALSDDVDAAQLCLGLADFWLQSGYRREGRDYIERVLAHTHVLPTFVQLPLLRYAGLLARRQGDLPGARSQLELALDHAHKSVAYTLNLLGLVAANQGSVIEVEQFYQESMALWQRLGSARNAAAVLNNLAALVDSAGQYARAIELHEQAIELRRALKDRKGVGDSLCNLGMVALHQQDFARAQSYFEESLEIARSFPDEHVLATNLGNLAFSLVYQGDHARAIKLFHQSLALYQQLGDQRGIAYGLEGIACAIAWQAGEQASTLFAAASTLRERINAPLPEIERSMYAALQAAARHQIGEALYTSAAQAGRTLALDQAISTALST